MRNCAAIMKKELYTLFTSPIAYIVLAGFFAMTGFFFYIITTNIIARVLQQSSQAQQFGGAAPALDVPALIMRNYLGVLSTILLFTVPMITMGLLAEEKKRGTIELLFTSPVRNIQLILGKFCAVLLMLAILLIPTVLNSLLVYLYSQPKPPLGPIVSGYLGAFLLGGTLMALGLFVSSLTENQIVAGFVTFVVFLFLWVIDAGVGTGTTALNEIARYLSVLNHYDDFTKGVIDSQNLVFYLSFIFLGLFLTSVSLDSAKWRQ